MNITIIGTGYVGLVNGACLANVGHDVTCIDINENKISNLNNGVIPIYEPGLEEIIKNSIKKGRLHFSTNYSSISDSKVTFIAVGTPPDEDGSADLRYVISAAKEFAKNIKSDYSVIVTKSTVPVGTSKRVKEAIYETFAEIDSAKKFSVVSNPEFLKEGSAVKDCLYPDRIVIGCEDEESKKVMKELYVPFIMYNSTILYTDIQSSEMIKYASNSMLATRISLMNEIANLCEKVGANVDEVRKGMSYDLRIGGKFLNAGCGYGGSCFPKDVKALIKTGEVNGLEMKVLRSVEDVNNSQKEILYKKLNKYTPISDGLVVSVLGLSFKPNTDDMREAPSIVLIEHLINAGATVRVYDPIAMNECKRRFGENVVYCADIYDAAYSSDAVILVTEWDEFKNVDMAKIKESMRGNIFIDGRNIYDKESMNKLGFTYDSIGR